jgi:predicted SnoaL-like aldol condensation-catalyzing enzyme
MIKEHPNITLLSKLDILNLDASSRLFSEDFVWHYFNPNLPDVQGDYVGIEGLNNFFKSLAGKTNGTFKVEVVSATPIGEELVVVHVRDTMELEDNSIAIDAVAVWRIVSGRFAEAWDIPSAYTEAT